MRNYKAMDNYTKSSASLVDDVGVLYISDRNMLRAIYEGAVRDVNEIMTSGLIDELVEKRLFPKTSVSAIRSKEYPLVLEHEKIDPVIYPFEWSPEMLRKAALCVLAVNEIANNYGYELKDAHPYNVVFRYNTPMFVDFGSFAERRDPWAWRSFDEFMGSFYYPLRLREKQLTKLYKHMYLMGGIGIGRAELSVILNPICRILGVTITDKLLHLFRIYRQGSTIGNKKIDARFKQPFMRALARFALRSKRLPLRCTDNRLLAKKIEAINLRNKSMWSDYQERAGFYSEDGHIELSPRMSWVVDVVSDLKPKTVIELGGNQGILSRILAKVPGVERVVCTDYDENAVDALLLNAKEDEKVAMACFNFMGEAWQTFSNERADRLRSEMVIALAVTHHLLLTQHYNIDRILSTMVSFSSKYLIVEFMPLGLWNGNTAPAIPNWYTETWFINSLKCHCIILQRQELEPNRIAFVTRIKCLE